VIAESVLMKHQLLIVNRSRRRAPEPPRLGSTDCWILFALDQADSLSPGLMPANIASLTINRSLKSPRALNTFFTSSMVSERRSGRGHARVHGRS
jgi:hypothetical protein